MIVMDSPVRPKWYKEKYNSFIANFFIVEVVNAE